MYIIMAPGDEATIEFDASSASALPPGWKRDFLLYTDGWIKDSDLNTAFGTTVGPAPLPRRAGRTRTRRATRIRPTRRTSAIFASTTRACVERVEVIGSARSDPLGRRECAILPHRAAI